MRAPAARGASGVAHPIENSPFFPLAATLILWIGNLGVISVGLYDASFIFSRQDMAWSQSLRTKGRYDGNLWFEVTINVPVALMPAD